MNRFIEIKIASDENNLLDNGLVYDFVPDYEALHFQI